MGWSLASRVTALIPCTWARPAMARPGAATLCAFHMSNSGVQSPQARSRGGRVESHARARFLTVAEVAELMRVSTMTVYRLIKGGDLAAVRVGKSYRVREDDVDRYLGSRYNAAG